MKVELGRIKDILGRFDGRHIAILGDVMLDRYIWGDVNRISPEAPVPVVEVRREEITLGGAANVAHNIKELGGIPYLIGVVGDDNSGESIKGLLAQQEIDPRFIILDASRPTTTKTRVIGQNQQVVRIDRETTENISKKIAQMLLSHLRVVINEGAEAVIISNYGKGTITRELLSQTLKLARETEILTAVDPKEDHFPLYRGITLITPNKHEAEKAVGFEITDESSLEAAGKKLLDMLSPEIVLITLGENGMAIFEPNRCMKKVPTFAKEVYDVTGAGDTVVSAYTLAIASGATAYEAAIIANHAAGIVVAEVGTATVTVPQLINYMEKYGHYIEH